MPYRRILLVEEPLLVGFGRDQTLELLSLRRNLLLSRLEVRLRNPALGSFLGHRQMFNLPAELLYFSFLSAQFLL